MTQFEELAKRFPDKLIKKKPGAYEADYFPHGVVRQRLLHVLGPYSQRIDQIIRDENGTAIAIAATIETEIDGKKVSVSEIGEINRGNIKGAMSDFTSRAAMTLGCGLQLWCNDKDIGNYYRLDEWLEKKAEGNGARAIQEVKEQI